MPKEPARAPDLIIDRCFGTEKRACDVMSRRNAQFLVEKDGVDMLAGQRVQYRAVLATSVGRHKHRAVLGTPAAVLTIRARP